MYPLRSQVRLSPTAGRKSSVSNSDLRQSLSLWCRLPLSAGRSSGSAASSASISPVSLAAARSSRYPAPSTEP